MLTARDAEVDRILGLELGADDYVVKPFSPRELVARVKAVLRRGKTIASPVQVAKSGVLKFPGLSVDPDSRLVLVSEQPVNLTPKEYELLLHLAKSPNRIYTREELLVSVGMSKVYANPDRLEHPKLFLLQGNATAFPNSLRRTILIQLLPQQLKCFLIPCRTLTFSKREHGRYSVKKMVKTPTYVIHFLR